MCDYCNVNKNDAYRMLMLEPKIKPNGHPIFITIDRINSNYYLRSIKHPEIGSGIQEIYETHINFCPICGRSLKGAEADV